LRRLDAEGPAVLLPRRTGAGFTPYVWASTAAEVAARHGLSPAHVIRFDANLPPFPARLRLPLRTVLAERGEYPEGSYSELRTAAAGYAGCRIEETSVDSGADGLIGVVARTFLAPGRRAVVEEPTYPLYAIASRLEGADVVFAPRDLGALADAARGAHVLWLCNPGNPTGELWAPEDIAAVADSLAATLVCVDEAYFEYAGATVAPFARERSNLVCVRTLSKAFGLAGLRVGYAIACEEVAAELERRRTPAPISTVAARFATDALRAPPIAPDVEAVLAERERVRRAFTSAGFDAPPVHANFVYVRTQEAGALAARLEERGLVVRGYEDALRITVRTPADDDLLLAALDLERPGGAPRSATVLRPGARASLVLEGSGRVRVSTGDDARNRRFERLAREATLDLELVAEEGVRAEDVAAALGEALAGALAAV
jgi:histidinol-phosphate aminotransferase